MENSSQLKVSPCLFSTPVCCITFQSARSGLTILKRGREEEERRERGKEGERKEGKKKGKDGGTKEKRK